MLPFTEANVVWLLSLVLAVSAAVSIIGTHIAHQVPPPSSLDGKGKGKEKAHAPSRTIATYKQDWLFCCDDIMEDSVTILRTSRALLKTVP